MEGQNITIESGKRITATEIVSVDAFSDKQIIMSYANGRILVQGSGMKIVGFSKSTGAFSATGEITGLRYMPKGMSIKQKLFR